MTAAQINRRQYAKVLRMQRQLLAGPIARMKRILERRARRANPLKSALRKLAASTQRKGATP